MKNKKGITRDVLIGLIILIASAAIIILALGIFSPLYGETAEKEACLASVTLRSNAIIQQTEKLGMKYPLKCKTENLCLATSGKCPENMKRESVSDEKEIKKEIADEIYDCWHMMGEGKLQFLGEKRCVVCSIIHFNDETRKKFSSINGLNDYLVNIKVPGKEFTYLEYVMGTGKEEVNKKLEIVGEDKISTYGDYAIAYVSAKEDTMGHLITFIKTFIPAGMVATAAVGFFFPEVALPALALKAIFAGGAVTPMLIEKIIEIIKIGECSREEGCAFLFFFPYGAEHAKEIAEICPKAEFIP